MKTLLHVGCGAKRKDKTTQGFQSSDWSEIRLDIDESVKPDIVGSIADMSAVKDASVDAVFSSHNIEHLYPTEVAKAFEEFKRVLKPDGFLVITCPDLQSVAALVAEDKLTAAVYQSPAGPIAPVDIIFGHRPSVAVNPHMAHHCGFTASVLIATLQVAGFKSIASKRRPGPAFDLWAVATVADLKQEELAEVAKGHIPL